MSNQRYIHRSLGCLLIVVCAVANADEQTKGQRLKAYEDIPDGRPVIHSARAGELQADGWCTAQATRGGFKVELPGQYVDQMLKHIGKEDFPGGVMHTVVTFTEDRVEFNVLQTELFGDRPKVDMAASIAERLKNKGAEVEQVDIELDGIPGKKLIVTHPKQRAVMAIVSKGQSDYMLSVQYSPSLPRDLTEDIKRFHNSFTILNKNQ